MSMFGWFKKKPKLVLVEALPQAPDVTAARAAPQPVAPQVSAPVALVPAPIPLPQLAVPQAIAPNTQIDPHDYEPASARVGMPALMLAPSGARRLTVTSVQACGRRLLARETGSRRCYAFTKHADGNYYLGDAHDNSAATLIVGLPLARAAA